MVFAAIDAPKRSLTLLSLHKICCHAAVATNFSLCFALVADMSSFSASKTLANCVIGKERLAKKLLVPVENRLSASSFGFLFAGCSYQNFNLKIGWIFGLSNLNFVDLPKLACLKKLLLEGFFGCLGQVLNTKAFHCYSESGLADL